MRDHTVAVAVGRHSHPFEFSVACEVFGLERPELGVEWYRFQVCATDPPPLSVGAFTLDTPYGLAELAAADTVIVPAADPHRPAPPATLAALRRAYERGARMVSFCSGAFALAEAGILDGRPVTTHWMHAAELARRYPSLDVHPDVLYVDDGQVLTSAGTAAGIDLALHLVRRDHGAEIANKVARRMVVPPHRDGGQAQFVDAPISRDDDPAALAATLEWALDHLDQALTVEQLAAHALMSGRTFARRFRALTGTTPMQWLAVQRIRHAQRLLETTDWSIDEVARRCGLGTAANLRLHFRRVCATTPTAYRAAFRRGAETSRAG
ncbi:MAG TPA: helix-turn-helix domain-containing protein [Acidimicrobiia bacterium]|nr:helix-turn-helix domain-containing protein [Acidimicrobiia bacterium]